MSDFDKIRLYSEHNNYGIIEDIGFYTTRYEVEVWNTFIDEERILRDTTMYGLQLKIENVFKIWAEKEKKLETKKKDINNRESAEARTEKYKNLFYAIDNILIHTLSVNDAVDWDILKDKSKFIEKNPTNELPQKIAELKEPILGIKEKYPRKPKEDDVEFIPEITLLDHIFVKRKKNKINSCWKEYESELKIWENKCVEINKRNEFIESEYNRELLKYEQEREAIEIEYRILYNEWLERKENFKKKQDEYNAVIENRKETYLSLDKIAVIEYCELVLDNSRYPDFISKKFDISYNPENRILVVEYFLPAPEKFPREKEVRYIATKKEMKEFFISDAEANRIFDQTMYNITLRSLHELFESDVANAIDTISFNGWIDSIDKATGNKTAKCILSVQVKKEEFEKINLANVDSKICFKNLKGVSGSKLSAIIPVRPILQIERNDRRVIESYNVVDEIDPSTNLASMDWEDFEHLVREVFEKEFSHNGGEVKVTQASKDGGVDAIAFDPDPIRGGKIVIQAKRYTNTVSVSAVRDLYGTIMNEGATKGILVTTSDYGPDSYEFAKSKPITLLNGANLLYLLEKHGHHAKINIKEARENK